MDNETLRTLTAAIILAGSLANPEAGSQSIETRSAIVTADRLLAALKGGSRPDDRKTPAPPEYRPPETGWYPKDRYGPDGRAVSSIQ